MIKNLIISIVAALLLPTVLYQAAIGSVKKTKLIKDGTILAGADGELRETDKSKASCWWFFEFEPDANDETGQIIAEANLELLPSTTLEKMAEDANGRTVKSYRLWGKVTEYKGRNFVFPTYFLPLSKAKQPQQSAPQESVQTETQLIINEPNDALTIPREILERLTTRKTISNRHSAKPLQLQTDYILADRTGFIVKQPDGRAAFVIEGLGRNLQTLSIQLLPCRILEQAQNRLSAEPDPVRFRIAGIVTRYKGQDYLLLQQAVRLYSHGNFGK